MTALSLAFPGQTFLGQALSHFCQPTVREEQARPRVVRLPDPEPVAVRGVRDPVEVKLASEPDEWEQAFRLVCGNYQQKGYETAREKAFRFTPYHALPETAVFVARQQNRVVATFSLVPDNNLLGLPLESLYADEINSLRQEGQRLGEVTSLACTDLDQRTFLPVFMTMIRVMFQYHVSRGGTSWVFTVNPRHGAFYRKVLAARQLGACKSYAVVGDAPAEPFLIEPELMRTSAPRSYEHIFGESLGPEVLTGPRLPRPFIRYFGSESSQVDESRLNTLLRTLAQRDSTRAW
jgi:hypothetical protein